MLPAMSAALLVWLADIALCSAAVLTYSWSGQFVPNVAGEDPWSLGVAGQPFELRASVQDNATDTFYLNAEFAAFAVQSVHLAINGVDVEYVGEGAMDFTDNHNETYDIVTFEGKFRRFGQIFDIGSGITLPMSWFSFTSLVVPPPFFAPTTNALHTTFSPPGPYTGVVDSGVSVTVVPEPGMGALMILAAVSFFFMQRRHLTS
jgi:hypothetical protein